MRTDSIFSSFRERELIDSISILSHKVMQLISQKVLIEIVLENQIGDDSQLILKMPGSDIKLLCTKISYVYYGVRITY